MEPLSDLNAKRHTTSRERNDKWRGKHGMSSEEIPKDPPSDLA
jgi:hypothetical protein